MHTDLTLEAMSDAAWQSTGVYRRLTDWGSWSWQGRSQWIVNNPESGAKLIVEMEDDEPAWLLPTLNSLCEILALPANWDSYGARPIELKAAASALECLDRVMRRDTIAPTAVPTVLGGIQLEWHTRGINLEIEVSPQGRCYVYCQEDNTEWEGELTHNLLNRLHAAIQQLSQHS